MHAAHAPRAVVGNSLRAVLEPLEVLVHEGGHGRAVTRGVTRARRPRGARMGRSRPRAPPRCLRRVVNLEVRAAAVSCRRRRAELDASRRRPTSIVPSASKGSRRRRPCPRSSSSCTAGAATSRAPASGRGLRRTARSDRSPSRGTCPLEPDLEARRAAPTGVGDPVVLLDEAARGRVRARIRGGRRTRGRRGRTSYRRAERPRRRLIALSRRCGVAQPPGSKAPRRTCAEGRRRGPSATPRPGRRAPGGRRRTTRGSGAPGMPPGAG